MPKLTICIPTYGRESSLKDLCCEILKPIHERYRELVSICIRDNSIGLDGYDFEYIYNLFDFADYQLNIQTLSITVMFLRYIISARRLLCVVLSR